MNINRKNYESYFTDYLDGSLTSAQLNELRVFLLLNDDLADMLESLHHAKLSVPQIRYLHKSVLKKDELHECNDYYAIATAEKCLTETDIHFIRQYPHADDLSGYYLKLKLKPDLRIRYSRKSRLYPPERFRILSYGTAVAASFLLLMGIGYLFYNRPSDAEEMLRVNTMFVPTPPGDTTIDQPSGKTQPQQRIKESRQENSRGRTTFAMKSKTEVFPPVSIRRQPLSGISLSTHIHESGLILKRKLIQPVSQPEIYLAEAANEWKSSEKNVFGDNIFTSMINTGRLIAEKIKNKEYRE